MLWDLFLFGVGWVVGLVCGIVGTLLMAAYQEG